MKNWKTSLSGVLALLPSVLHAILPNVISSEVAVAITSLFTTIGLISAKDKNVTGGTVQQ